MRSEQIKLCYRATFRQPIGALNPAGFMMAAPVEVEIRKAGGHWAAYRPGSKSQFEEITEQPSAAAMQGQMSLYFQDRISDWTAWEILESGMGYKQLQPGSYSVDTKGRALKKTE